MFKSKSEDKAEEMVVKSLAEEVRRREFCIQQAAWVCDERPGDVIRTAETIYEWIYGKTDRH